MSAVTFNLLKGNLKRGVSFDIVPNVGSAGGGQARIYPPQLGRLITFVYNYKFSTEGRTRTGTWFKPYQILSLARLPIPPLRQIYKEQN